MASNSSGRVIFCSTLRQGIRLAFWNTNPTARRGPVTGSPWKNTSPEVGNSRPASIRSKVLLPLPEGPKIHTNSCGKTEKVTRSRACSPPFPFGKDRADRLHLDQGPVWLIGHVLLHRSCLTYRSLFCFDKFVAIGFIEIERLGEHAHVQQHFLHILPGFWF